MSVAGDLRALYPRVLARTIAFTRRLPDAEDAVQDALERRAKTAASTDWQQIAELYALLEGVRPAPAVRVNRAFAVARARGAGEGLALLDDSVADYPYVHLVRGALFEELGRDEEAIASLHQATSHARNEHEARQIRERIARLREKSRS